MTDFTMPVGTGNGSSAEQTAAAASPVTAASPADVTPLQIDALHDVELEVVAVLGKTRMTLGDLRAVRPRTTIPLDRPLGSPLEIMVNGKLFAYGELVAVNDSELGVQIRSVVSGRD